MYDKNEIITIKWTTRNKKYYEQLGYEYTNIGDNFEIKAGDLPEDSSIHITAHCDCEDCKATQSTPFRNYNRIIKSNGLYMCKSCTFSNAMSKRDSNNRNKLYSIFLQKCIERNCTPITSIDDFQDGRSYVKYICPKHGEVQSTIHNIVHNNAWCYQCGKESMSQNQRFSSEKVKEIIENKNDNILLNANEYVNINTKNLRVICGSCGNVFTTSLASMVNSNGRCHTCGELVGSNLSRTTKEDAMNMSIIDGKVMMVNPYEYLGMGIQQEFYCTVCGTKFLTTPYNYIKREYTRCRECHKTIKSKGAEKIDKILESYHIEHIHEHKFSDCKDKRRLPFDFYLPNNHAIIEYDGLQHFKPIKYFGGEKAFKILQKHDQMKNEYCALNNISILRIPYFEYDNIETIVKNFLNLQ